MFPVLHRAYFAVNVLDVVTELLENSKHDAVQIIGCQTLTGFIYSQVIMVWFLFFFLFVF